MVGFHRHRYLNRKPLDTEEPDPRPRPLGKAICALNEMAGWNWRKSKLGEFPNGPVQLDSDAQKVYVPTFPQSLLESGVQGIVY